MKMILVLGCGWYYENKSHRVFRVNRIKLHSGAVKLTVNYVGRDMFWQAYILHLHTMHEQKLASVYG
jgi:hypothetical protein